MKKKVSVPTAILLMILSAAVAVNMAHFYTLGKFNNYLSDMENKQAMFAKFNEVYQYVSDVFVGQYDAYDAMDGAMQGYVDALGDRWSHYLTAEEYASLMNTLNNKYTGVGVGVGYDAETKILTISQIYKNSSAEKAGIEAGDTIVAVDGNRVETIGFYDAISKIRGEEGTVAWITIVKKGTQREIEYNLKRTTVNMKAVSSKMLENNIGYIKIDNFDANVDKDFEQQLNALIKDGACGLIFDVRDNGGGSDKVLLPMLDMLLPEGVIFSMKDKEGNLEQYTSDVNEISMPMTVIVNQNSYSAAEFFAAALQELNKAVIVGERTSGKGFAQSTIPLSDGSGLYLSTRMYYTPKGKSLAGVGITPDVQIAPDDSSDEDNQLYWAIKSILDKTT